MATIREISEEKRMPNNVQRIITEIQQGRRCFIIKGAAGTGKTTLIRSLVPVLRAQGFQSVLMAPTGRAAMVLGERTGCDCRTIHSHIYDCNDEPIKNENGDALKFVFPLKHGYGHDIEDTVFIVDEASMVGLSRHDNDRELFQFGSGSLLRDLIDYAGLNVPNTSNVLVFVGDPYQLPPVKENCTTPSALDEVKIQELTGCAPYIVELTTVYRQKNESGILEEATKLRECLARKEFNYCRFSSHDDLTIENAEHFLDSLRPEVDLDDKIVIAHTNMRVKELNNLVRNRLHYSTPYPTSGERLLVIRNARRALPDGSINQFYNGEFVKVKRDYEKEFRCDGFYTPKDGHKTYHFSFVWRKMNLGWIYDPKVDAEGIWVNISPIVSKEWDENEAYAKVALYNGIKQAIESKLRQEGRCSPEEVREKLRLSPLLHAPVVRFGYAVTGHKSQGGEWDQAWIDYAFGPTVHSEFFFRWAYTATTRAKQHLHALYPPEIDALADVFCPQTTRMPTVDTQLDGSLVGGATPMNLMTTFLESKGIVVAEMRQLANRCRVIVKDPVTRYSNGYVDLVYKSNGHISSIESRLANDSDMEIQKELQELFLGKIVDVVLGRCKGVESPNVECDSGLTEQMKRVVERVKIVAQAAGIRMSAAKALTQYQLRLSFSSSHGNGMLDFYFDKKGRLTSCDGNKLPVEDYNTISQSFGKEQTCVI